MIWEWRLITAYLLSAYLQTTENPGDGPLTSFLYLHETAYRAVSTRLQCE